MAFDKSLAGRIRDALAGLSVEEKKMFGGVGFLLGGNMLVGVWKDWLIVRLGPEKGDEAVLEPHVQGIRHHGSDERLGAGDPEGVEDDERLKEWIERAMKFVGTLPRKSGIAAMRRFRRFVWK